MKANDFKLRTKRFALSVLKLVNALPKTIERRAVAAQLVRSGTSVAANYRAACRGRSKAEFVAKLGVTLGKADTQLWLELIIEGGPMPRSKASSLLSEASELVAILVTSRKSAVANWKFGI
jgi:four helix bundle protein